MSAIMVTGGAIEPASQVNNVTNALKIDVLDSVKSFYSELVTMLKEFADPESPLTINGTIYDADQKQTASVQLLMQNRMDEIQNVQGSLINIINIMFQLDKTASQIGGGG